MDEIKKELIKQILPHIGDIVGWIFAGFAVVIPAGFVYLGNKLRQVSHTLKRSAEKGDEDRTKILERQKTIETELNDKHAEILHAVENGPANKTFREIRAAEDLHNETSSNRQPPRADRREGDAMNTKAGRPIEPKEEPQHGTP